MVVVQSTPLPSRHLNDPSHPPPPLEVFMSCGHAGSISAVDLKQVAGGKSPGRRGRRGRTRSDLLLSDVTVQRRAVNMNGGVTVERKEEGESGLRKLRLLASSARHTARTLVAWVQLGTRGGQESTRRLLQEKLETGHRI